MDPTDSTKNLSNNRFNDAIFDNVAVENYFVEIEGIRYPKGPINEITAKMIVQIRLEISIYSVEITLVDKF